MALVYLSSTTDFCAWSHKYIEASVLRRLEHIDGLFLPDIVKERYVFFAIDNIDFQEDTCDGGNTLRGKLYVNGDLSEVSSR